MSDPTLSDIDFEDKMAWVWTTLKNQGIQPTHMLSIIRFSDVVVAVIEAEKEEADPIADQTVKNQIVVDVTTNQQANPGK